MNIYCITPIHDPKIEYLEKNIESIRNQTVKTKHMLVFDGIPKNKKQLFQNIDFDGIEILELPICHNDYGDTPRYMGAVSAFSRKADAVFWLDDDNWVDNNHVEIMSSEIDKDWPITTCQRNICNLEGEIMGLCFETDPYKFIDMNCYFIHESVKNICTTLWTMQSDHHIFDDKILYATIRKHNIPFKYYKTPTVNYRTNFNFHYEYYGYPVPKDAKDGVGVQYTKKKNEIMV